LLLTHSDDMRVNNIEQEQVSKAVEEFKAMPDKAVKTISVEGVWLLDNPSVQFVATAKAENNVFNLEVDSPSFLGGSGSRPGPMHYCLIGLSSCFMATLVGVATEKGILLKKASVRASCVIDFRKPLGIGDTKPVRSIRFELSLESDASRQRLEEVVKEAEERCPAIYSMKNPLTPEIALL